MSVAFLSTIFLRLSAYFFLRWLPTPVCLPLVGILYVTYVLALILGTSEKSTENASRDVNALDRHLNTKTPRENAAKTMKSDSKVLQGVLFGAPSPSWKVNFLTASINTMLLVFTLDFSFRSRYLYPSEDISFIRLGHVTCQSAKLTLREPFAPNVSLSYRVDGNDEWIRIPANATFTNETDYVQSVTIEGLQPATKYAYVASNNISGQFTTPSRRSRGTFSFVTSSCIKARFPYTPLQHPLHVRGFAYLASALNQISPSFMLFLGDFIYGKTYCIQMLTVSGCTKTVWERCRNV